MTNSTTYKFSYGFISKRLVCYNMVFYFVNHFIGQFYAFHIQYFPHIFQLQDILDIPHPIRNEWGLSSLRIELYRRNWHVFLSILVYMFSYASSSRSAERVPVRLMPRSSERASVFDDKYSRGRHFQHTDRLRRSFHHRINKLS